MGSAGGVDPREEAPEPEIRAPFLRLYLKLEGIAPADAAALRAGIGPDAVRRIEHAPTTGWLPVSLEIAMLRSLHAVSGDEGVLDVTRRLGRSGFRMPLFRPLLTATIGMLGSRPDILLRFAIASWHLAMRHAGTGRIVESAPGKMRVLHHGLPAAWDRLLLLRVCGSLEALLERSRVSPRVEVEWTPASGRALYVISWR